jgi:hypothetical protein
VTTEPAALIAGITAVVSAVISLLVAFGLDITEDQSIAILAATGAILPLIAGFLTRARVTPVP